MRPTCAAGTSMRMRVNSSFEKMAITHVRRPLACRVSGVRAGLFRDSDRLVVDDLVEVFAEAVPHVLVTVVAFVTGRQCPAGDAFADACDEPVAVGVLATVAQR